MDDVTQNISTPDIDSWMFENTEAAPAGTTKAEWPIFQSRGFRSPIYG